MKSLTVASLTICTLLSLPVFGQIDIGVISGTVQDNSNSVVAGVKITATNEGNQATRQTVTNSSGYYTFPISWSVHIQFLLRQMGSSGTFTAAYIECCRAGKRRSNWR